jgi:MarR family transcriptional regulator, organic hydroperoxide resistance regulator
MAELRAAFSELLGAERRLRGRNPARKGELSNAQVRALFHLAEGEACTSGELAKRAELSPASMTTMLDQLEADGIVERHRSETDRRQVFVTLTTAGHEALHARRQAWEQLWREELKSHPVEDIEAAARVMRSLAQMIDGVGRDSPT